MTDERRLKQWQQAALDRAGADLMARIGSMRAGEITLSEVAEAPQFKRLQQQGIEVSLALDPNDRSRVEIKLSAPINTPAADALVELAHDTPDVTLQVVTRGEPETTPE